MWDQCLVISAGRQPQPNPPANTDSRSLDKLQTATLHPNTSPPCWESESISHTSFSRLCFYGVTETSDPLSARICTKSLKPPDSHHSFPGATHAMRRVLTSVYSYSLFLTLLCLDFFTRCASAINMHLWHSHAYLSMPTCTSSTPSLERHGGRRTT